MPTSTNYTVTGNGITGTVAQGVPALVAGASNPRFQYMLGIFGDSITHNGYYNSAVAATAGASWFNSTAADNFARAWGWATFVGPLSMQRAQVVKSWARQTNGLLTPGSTPTGYPLSVQITEALNDPLWPQVNRVVILIGTNDYSYTINACIQELLTQIRRLGKPVDLITSPPRSDAIATTTGGDSMQGWAWLAEWRLALRRVADQSGGYIRWIDGYGAINNPTASPDAYASGRSYDNIHPNNVGAYLIADAYVQSLFPSGIGGELDVWNTAGWAGSTGANGLIDQGFANPTLATASGGTGTGTIAGSLTVTNINAGTHSGSVAACTIPGGSGNMQTIAITSTTGGGGDGVDIAGATMHASGGTFLSVGDTAYAQCLLRINSGGIYPRNLFWRLQGFDGTTNWNALLWEVDNTKENALPLTATRTFLLRTPILTKSAAAYTNLQFKLRATFAGAGTCTIDISNLSCHRFRSGVSYT